jgi:hypothetical protein
MSRFCAYFSDFLSHFEEFCGQMGEFGENLEGLGGTWRFFGKFFWVIEYLSVVFKGL